jgi:hypothetical protein
MNFDKGCKTILRNKELQTAVNRRNFALAECKDSIEEAVIESFQIIIYLYLTILFPFHSMSCTHCCWHNITKYSKIPSKNSSHIFLNFSYQYYWISCRMHMAWANAVYHILWQVSLTYKRYGWNKRNFTVGRLHGCCNRFLIYTLGILLILDFFITH